MRSERDIFGVSRRNFLASLVGSAAWAALPRSVRAAGVEALPKVLADYLEAVVQDLNGVASDYPEGFFFVTDIHNPSNYGHSGRMIAALASRTGLWKTFCGGDLPGAYKQEGRTAREEALWAWQTYQEGWIDPICRAGGVVYTARGNHDLSVRDSSIRTTGATISAEETMALFRLSHRRPFAVSNAADPTACYFYRDVPTARIRYVVADSSDTVSSDLSEGWGVRYGIRGTQLVWLADVAFGTLPDGWDVVVIQHIPPAPIVTDCSGEEPSLRNFRLLTEAFQNRGRFTFGERVWDFSAAKGRVLLHLSGHEHADRWSHWNGIPYVTVACDARYSDYIKWSPYCGDLPKKSPLDIFSQTFDAVRISADHETILLQRIGGGQDRLLHTRVRKVSAGESLRLSARSLQDPTWIQYDGDQVKQNANVTDPADYCTFFHDHAMVDATGLVKGLTPGSSMVFAHDSDYRKEMYCVETV